MLLAYYTRFTTTRAERNGRKQIWNILWDTTLNPQTRQLIRLTMSDLDTELDVVKILHGNNPDDRKKFMEGYRVEKDMLDT